MSEKDIVSVYAKELKLASVRENAALFAEDAMREQWGYLTFLRRLLEEEVTQRREKSKITRIHRADFPQMKYLEELQREELPLEGQMLLPEVETLEFIKEGRSIASKHALKDTRFSLHPCHVCLHISGKRRRRRR